MEFTLTLTPQDIDIIGKGLGEVQIKDGLSTYLKVLNQVEQQKQAANQQQVESEVPAKKK